MRRSAFAASGIGLAALGLVFTGCAAPAPAETPAASASAESTPTPTVDAIALGPAEMPPLEFDGDCERALPAEDLARIVGFDVALDSMENRYLANLGALECAWTTSDGDQVRLDVVLRAAVDGPVFPAEHESAFFDDCGYDGYRCSWQGGDASVWIAGDFVGTQATHEEVVAWGQAMTERVLENRTHSDSWTRDRSGWWFALDCAQVATAIGAQSGRAIEGQFSAWDADLPPVAYAVSLTTAGQTRCFLFDTEAGRSPGSLRILPGEGARPVEDGYEAVDLGIPGITAFVDVSDSEESRPTYILSNGVNRIELFVPEDAGPAEQFATAVAAAAASDFQP